MVSTLRQRALQSREAIELLRDKWRITVLHLLRAKRLRTSELQRAMPSVSPKMLTQTLRGMERDGLVDRQVRPVRPAHVEYALTDMGREVVPLLKTLFLWAEANAKKRDEARARFDRGSRG